MNEIENFIDKWENDMKCDLYELVDEFTEYMKLHFSQFDVTNFQVFDSPGLDIYVLFITWIDSDMKLQTIYGTRNRN